MPCSHGTIEVYVSNNPEFPGKARCGNCGAWLVAANDRAPSVDQLADDQIHALVLEMDAYWQTHVFEYTRVRREKIAEILRRHVTQPKEK